jgi:hypothetical protein
MPMRVSTVRSPLAERRRHPRFAAAGRIELAIDRWAVLELHDVSLGGLRVSLPQRPAIGQRFAIILKLPVHELLLGAEVCNARDDLRGVCGVGLRWVDVDELHDEHQALKQLLESAQIAHERTR